MSSPTDTTEKLALAMLTRRAEIIAEDAVERRMGKSPKQVDYLFDKGVQVGIAAGLAAAMEHTGRDISVTISD